MELNEITENIIGRAMKVHTALGPGLLESTYEVCLVHEVAKSNMKVVSQLPLPVVYDGIRLRPAVGSMFWWKIKKLLN